MAVEPIRDPKKIADMRKILRGSKYGPRDDALFVLGINTALRIGDLLGLTLGDVMDAGGKTRDAVELVEQKTGKSRRCPLNKAAKEALGPWLAIRMASGNTMGEPLFTSRKGDRAITRQHAFHLLSEAGAAVGLKNVGTHSLRKTFGYHVFKKSGGNLTLVQKLLNHGSGLATLRYVGIDREQMDEAFLEINLG
jgi:integrase